jgi:hypothetical protein
VDEDLKYPSLHSSLADSGHEELWRRKSEGNASCAHAEAPEKPHVLLVQMVGVTGHVCVGAVRNVLRVLMGESVPYVGTLACNTCIYPYYLNRLKIEIILMITKVKVY